MKYNYHLIVIGAGSGGLVAAELAAKLGAKVALIEAREQLGGECLHTGCVPSKSFIHAARAAWNATHSQRFGLAASVSVDFSKIMQHVRSAISHIETQHDNDAFYEKLGIDVIHARAEIVDAHTVLLGERHITARRIIVASGSTPTAPPISGLDKVQYLTNETVFSLDEQPESLVVIGGGPIGCELGQAFSMLGTKVTLIQSGDRLLPRDEPEASAAVLKSLKAMGTTVVLDARVESASEDTEGNVLVSLGSGSSPIIAQKVLIATGRTPTMVPGLEKAAVKLGERGIGVDEHMRTNVSSIYAIGDCNGRAYFTHTAAEQAVIAVQNALFGFRKKYDDTNIPWVTFTLPEAAHFGALKSQLKPGSYVQQTLNYSEIDKAVAEGEEGYIEVLTDSHNKVLGATVVGANASELIGYVSLLKHLDRPLGDIAGSIQPYPTYSLGLKQLASYKLVDDTTQGISGKLLQLYLGKKK